MKKTMKRFLNSRGETLVESLCSILIFTLASILFLSMVTSANRINMTTREADSAFKAQQNAVESGSGSTTNNGSVTIKLNGNANAIASDSTKVVVPGDGSDGLVAIFPD